MNKSNVEGMLECFKEEEGVPFQEALEKAEELQVPLGYLEGRGLISIYGGRVYTKKKGVKNG